MKRSKLKLNRETIAHLEGKLRGVVGGDCTCSCCPTCYSDCGCPPPTGSCGDTCATCPTMDNASNCICA